ncbi:MAG: hypothetical protein R2750_03320 [Bacteroidales bacterium]
MILEHLEASLYQTIEEKAINCYTLRTFHFFMKMYGLVNSEERGKDRIASKLFIKKTSVLDQVFRFEA